MKKLGLLQLILFSISLFLFTACSESEHKNQNNEEVTLQQEVSKIESAMNDLQNKYDEIRQRKPSEAIDWAADDLKSIGDWEYKVIELSGLSAQDLEKELNDLGKDRWQVIWIKDTSETSMQVTLKRSTVSYLSKLPLSSIGRMMMNGEDQ